MKCGFTIKRPKGARKSFAVHRKIYIANQAPKQPQIKDERLHAINENFKNLVLNEHEALAQVRALIEKIKTEDALADTSVKRAEISSH